GETGAATAGPEPRSSISLEDPPRMLGGSAPRSARRRRVSLLQGGYVADGQAQLLGFEQPAHDFAAAGLGQAVHHLDFVGHRDGPDLLADELPQLADELLAPPISL